MSSKRDFDYLDLSLAASKLDTELSKIWVHLETRAFMDTRGMPELEGEEDEKRTSSPAVLALEGFHLDDEQPPPDEVDGPIILRERILLAMQTGEPWPTVPGMDTARARAAYAEFVRCTRDLGGRVVFVPLQTPMEEFVHAFPSVPGAEVTPESDEKAATVSAEPVALRRSVHLLLQTVTPGVALGDQMILAPEARCDCSQVHEAANVPVSALLCVEPPLLGHLHV